MAGGELRLGTASMYMAYVYHHIAVKSINKYPFTWLHICGQTKTSRAKSVASCFGMKEDQANTAPGRPSFRGAAQQRARNPCSRTSLLDLFCDSNGRGAKAHSGT